MGKYCQNNSILSNRAHPHINAQYLGFRQKFPQSWFGGLV